jgi:hypothetical protein
MLAVRGYTWGLKWWLLQMEVTDCCVSGVILSEVVVESAYGVSLRIGSRTLAVLLLLLATVSLAKAQALTTANQTLSLSAFGGGTGDWTGFDGGKSLNFTGGIDLRILSYKHFLPSVEIRGTEPFDKGIVDAQKNVVGGLKVERIYGRYHVYGDFLYGRGEIDYQQGGFVNPQRTVIYLQSNSNVYSFGGGVDYDVTHHFAAKLDFQLQHYDTPISPYTSIFSKDVTLGVVYRFDFNRRPGKQK